MFKGIVQLGLLGAALVATAVIEAAVPVWIADRTSSGVHIVSKADEGTMRGWRKCLSKNWQGDKNSHRAACLNSVATSVQGTLRLSDIRRDNGDICPMPSEGVWRSFSATVSNESSTIYVANAIWYGSYPTKPRATEAYSAPSQPWIVPGARKRVCLFSLKFQSLDHAAQYDNNPDQLHASILSERGMQKH